MIDVDEGGHSSVVYEQLDETVLVSLGYSCYGYAAEFGCVEC